MVNKRHFNDESDSDDEASISTDNRRKLSIDSQVIGVIKEEPCTSPSPPTTTTTTTAAATPLTSDPSARLVIPVGRGRKRKNASQQLSVNNANPVTVVTMTRANAISSKRPRRALDNSVVSDRLKQVISDRRAVNPKSG